MTTTTRPNTIRKLRKGPKAIGGSLLALTPGQVQAEGTLDRLVGAQHGAVDAHAAAAVAQLVAEVAEVLQVLAPEPAGVHQQPVREVLQVAEARQAAEGELDLLRGEDVEEQHLVAAVAEVLQRPQQAVGVVEAV